MNNVIDLFTKTPALPAERVEEEPTSQRDERGRNPDDDWLSGEEVADFLYLAQRLDEAIEPDDQRAAMDDILRCVRAWPRG